MLTIFLRIFPVKKNRILFYSFSGKDYSDSPKYISEYIDEKGDNYQIVWAVNEPEKFSYLRNKGYKIIKYNSITHLYYGLTAQYIVTNTGPYKALLYRKDQKIINTWHGGGAYKKTGIDNPYKDKYKKLYNEKFGQAGVTLFLSSSKAFTEYVIRGAFGYKGRIAEVGLPRNDILLENIKHMEITRKVKDNLGIEQCAKFVLYAPTWRNYEIGSYEKIDVELVINACKQKFGGEWILVYRGHNLSNGINNKSDYKKSVNATAYPDMQELMIASDILISDYSSCIWDYSLMSKPCFLFTPDLKKYDQTFAFYEPITKWGFDVCETNLILKTAIINFNYDKYTNRIIDNHNYFASTETGCARKYVYEYITANEVQT